MSEASITEENAEVQSIVPPTADGKEETTAEPAEDLEGTSSSDSELNDVEEHDEESVEALRGKVKYLKLKVEEVQGESRVLKEYGDRADMYVDCLANALGLNNVTHVYDVDGSLVSLEECRQKAKTLPPTKKPHCDDDFRIVQYQAELVKLDGEVETLRATLEDALLARAEQEYLVDQLRAAEYEANRRWEDYHGNVTRRWEKSYSELQDQHAELTARLQQRSAAAFDSTKSRGSTSELRRDRRQQQQYGTATSNRSAGQGHDPRSGAGYYSQTADQCRGTPTQQRTWRERSDHGTQRDGYSGRPALMLPRAERKAILNQYFANLNMIEQQQGFLVNGQRVRCSEGHGSIRRPGPYGECN